MLRRSRPWNRGSLRALGSAWSSPRLYTTRRSRLEQRLWDALPCAPGITIVPIMRNRLDWAAMALGQGSTAWAALWRRLPAMPESRWFHSNGTIAIMAHRALESAEAKHAHRGRPLRSIQGAHAAHVNTCQPGDDRLPQRRIDGVVTTAPIESGPAPGQEAGFGQQSQLPADGGPAQPDGVSDVGRMPHTP